LNDLQILLIIVVAAAAFWGYLELVIRVRE